MTLTGGLLLLCGLGIPVWFRTEIFGRPSQPHPQNRRASLSPAHISMAYQDQKPAQKQNPKRGQMPNFVRAQPDRAAEVHLAAPSPPIPQPVVGAPKGPEPTLEVVRKISPVAGVVKVPELMAPMGEASARSGGQAADRQPAEPESEPELEPGSEPEPDRDPEVYVDEDDVLEERDDTGRLRYGLATVGLAAEEPRWMAEEVPDPRPETVEEREDRRFAAELDRGGPGQRPEPDRRVDRVVSGAVAGRVGRHARAVGPPEWPPASHGGRPGHPGRAQDHPLRGWDTLEPEPPRHARPEPGRPDGGGRVRARRSTVYRSRHAGE